MDKILNKLQIFKNLAEGWHFGEGVPILDKATEVVRNLHHRFKIFNFTKDVFPGCDGSLALVFYFDDEICIEVSVKPEGEIDLYVEKGKGYPYKILESFEDITFGAAVSHIGKWGKMGRYAKL